MGGGGGEAPSSTTQYTSEVVTNTTTSLRDVGLTGANAVDLAAVLESGAIATNNINAKTLDHLIQEVGAGFKQLIGGAGKLVDTAGSVSSDSMSKSKAVSDKIISSGENVAKDILAYAGDVVGRSFDLASFGVEGARQSSRDLLNMATIAKADRTLPEDQQLSTSKMMWVTIALVGGLLVLRKA